MKFTTIKQAQAILKGGVECDLPYPTCLARLQDDTDGSTDIEHLLHVMQGPDGDMYVGVGASMLLRFRTENGGGGSLAVHNALRLLAIAVQMDEKTRPQKIKS